MKTLLNRAVPVARRALNDQLRFVQPEELNVAPHLVGAPLARPSRRALALGLDLLVVALLSGVDGLWLVAGLALVVLQLRTRRDVNPATAADGTQTSEAQEGREAPAKARRRLRWGWAAAALVLLLAASEAQQRWDDWRHPQTATRAMAQAVVPAASPAAVPAGESADMAPGAAPGAAPAASVNPDKIRIAQLEAELQEAHRHQPLTWRQQWSRWWDDLAAGLGWGIVYFSLLPAWWGGQTVGKKLFGLRVVELTGRPMTVMRCLKRYGGYAAGMATGGLGFAQVLWDVNRQALQDKAAHTVVIDLRATSAAVPDQVGGDA